MFKVNDKLDYGFYNDLTISDEDDKHFILQNKKGQLKPVYKWLVEKYGKKKEKD